ncbi:serpin family protein [Vitiosangium sp. GDMCC 1.1324]|uniref:serpin family protein n=1 Tax=Vitiosangium sp. (strain GDMCC 1.1324) TaxID=2138576 RepID=UPI000D39B6B4|nr:serpin family protein [Vitiosangium sp. GDMCC 1.1324]PTL76710.1 serpin family protein [Vitiosangium sp. GDMCC 1.1324]
METRRYWLSPVVAVLVVLSGCAQETPPPEAPGKLIASNLQRATPEVPVEELTSAATGNTELGVALYHQLASPGQNLFFSPLSITQSFAMVYAGARGNTAEQMRQALRFNLAPEQLHPAMNAIDLALHGRAARTQGAKETPPELRVVNATWGQQGQAFEADYLDVLAQQYGAGVRVVDFENEADSIRQRINAWIAGTTNDRIQNLLPEGSVTSDTRLVLTNALYFKGAWAEPFEASMTRMAPFQLLQGGTQQVMMMQREATVPYMRRQGFEAFALPYSGEAFRMVFIVPDSGHFAEIEAQLSAGFLDGVRGALVNRNFMLGLPRFRAETEFSLVEPLQQLGMVDAFNQVNADLSGISRQTRLFITGAQHKAFVAVDEAGTEAAAATGVVIGVESAAPEPLLVDRPFLFLIEDVETKTVLFLGRIVKPS